ncbi:MAG: hypothetical protein ACP5VN_08105 [Acidobacteriota bacterium]
MRPAGRAEGGSPIWILAAFWALLLLSYRGSSLNFGGDAGDWIQISQAPLGSLAFWTYRPWGTSLVYKVLGSNPWAILPFQVFLHGLSFSLLAVALLRWMRTAWGRAIAVAAVLGMGLSLELLLWPFTILSESLCNSLSILLLALLLEYLPAEDVGSAPLLRPAPLAALLGLAVLWSATRDTNPYTLLALGGAAGAGLLVPPFRRWVGLSRGAVAAAVLLGAALLQIGLAGKTTRNAWNYSLTDTVCDRILPDPEALAFFRREGMPVSPLLMSFAGRHNAYMANAVSPLSDESLRDRAFEGWVKEKGLPVYLRFLLRHPGKAAGWLWAARGSLFSPSLRTVAQVGPFLVVHQRENGRRVRVEPLFSRGTLPGDWPGSRAAAFFFFPRWKEFWVAALAVACLPLPLLRGRRPLPLLFLPVVLAGISLLQAGVVGLADPCEMDRHAVHLALTLRLAFFLALAMLLDAWAEGSTLPKRLAEWGKMPVGDWWRRGRRAG